MQGGPGPARRSNLDCSALLEGTAALLQGLGQQGAQLNIQRVLKLAVASVHHRADQDEGRFKTHAICILARGLETAGDRYPAWTLASDCIRDAQQVAARQAGQLAALRAVQVARQLPMHMLAAATAGLSPPPPPTVPPTDYLASLRHGMAAPVPAAELQRLVQDDREVAVGLTPSPADPAACRLTLRPLAAGRTLAAVAAHLAFGQHAPAIKACLQEQLRQGQAQRAACTRLLSAQRGVLLASAHSSPQPHPRAALARILHEAAGQRRLALQQQQQRRRLQQVHAATATEQHAPLSQQAQQRGQVNGLVLVQHKEMKKAWREKRAREQRERLAALRCNNVEEYVRLVHGAKNSKIEALLSQTDSCLRQLAARLHSAGVGRALLTTGAAGGSPALMGDPQAPGNSADRNDGGCSGTAGGGSGGGGRIAALEQSHEAWNQLARAFQVDMPHQPRLLTGGELREYQMAGLRWMVGLRRHGLNGILADEMGLGKTIQVIALVCHLVEEEQQEPHPALIAVPSSVLPNWEAELALWAPGLTVLSYKGSPDQREAVWEQQMGRRGGGAGAGAGPHVVLTTYEFLMAKHDKPRLCRVPWSYLVVDEGHRLKSAGCRLNAELRAYSTQHRLLLTGTPLQNRLEELWSLLNFLMPTLFSSGEDFQAWFGGAERCSDAAAVDGEVPSDDESAEAAEAAMLTDEETLLVTNRLHQVLRPFMLRRLKETVASELPQKVEHLLPVLPSPYQQALFRLMQQEMVGGALKGVNNVLMEMRNICNHPLISRLHPEGSEAALPAHSLPAEVRLCSKLELLDRLLVKLKAGGHKVLLFSTMTRALDVVADYLHWRGFSHLRLDGGTAAAERGDLVSRFNDPGGGVFVFLLSLRAGGVGLNLQGADTVIMYDTDFNPQMDLQAQARAHRMGQKNEVLVLRLKTIGMVEERVVRVASEKAQLADRSITGGFFDGKTSSEERQRYLLDTVLTSTQCQPGSSGAGGGDGTGAAAEGGSCSQLSDAQLNRLLARGKQELKLFVAEDRRMREAELASWQAALAVGGGATQRSSQAPYRRLASEEEVAPLMLQAQALLQPKKDEDAGLELGRGKRQRGTAAYRDMGERDFNRLCQEGVAAGQAPVLLLAAPVPAVDDGGGVAGGRPATEPATKRRTRGQGGAAPVATVPAATLVASRRTRKAPVGPAPEAPVAEPQAAVAAPVPPALAPEAAVPPPGSVDAVTAEPGEAAGPESHLKLGIRLPGARKAPQQRRRQQIQTAQSSPVASAGAAVAEPEPKRQRSSRHVPSGQEEGGSSVDAEGLAKGAVGSEALAGDDGPAAEPATKRRTRGQGGAAPVATVPAATLVAAGAGGKQCSNCGSAKTTSKMSGKETSTGACLCDPCDSFLKYHKRCSNCSSTRTMKNKWRKEPDTGACLCDSCGSFLSRNKRHCTAEDIATQQAKKAQAASEERRCTHCSATDTSMWRRHPDTRKLLCDGCGRHVRKHGQLPALLEDDFEGQE